MATPFSRSNSSGALSTGPSRTLLQQLLEEISGASSTRSGRDDSPPPSPTLSSPSPPSSYSRSSSQNHSPSVWVGGSILAQDAREKLRAADEARWRKAAACAIDDAPDSHSSRLYLDTSMIDIQNTDLREEHGRGAPTGLQRTPDPVRYPHDYREHVLKGSPLSIHTELTPGTQGHGDNLSHRHTNSFADVLPPPPSPLIFSDVYFDDSSLSPQTETMISPTDAPTSAATVYTTEELQTPTGNDSMDPDLLATYLAVANNCVALKQTHFVHDCVTDASAQQRRTMTVPDLRSNGYFEMAVDATNDLIGVGSDNRCLLRHETFTERAPTPRMSIDPPMSDILPELSSFRPTDADSQGQPSTVYSSNTVARGFSSPAQLAGPAAPDTPAWMRPMHLVDTGGKSIYTNVHDDGPIRHALCLWCFRTQGSFRKVHKYGYESCGRREVLDSHYWEDDKWSEDSSDESIDSDGSNDPDN
ncbi:hypothetical protein E8E11_006265 [Didymella keratinophila]|nr:hypothetical protein E8E11_006265 [Didymella keratinophila]